MNTATHEQIKNALASEIIEEVFLKQGNENNIGYWERHGDQLRAIAELMSFGLLVRVNDLIRPILSQPLRGLAVEIFSQSVTGILESPVRSHNGSPDHGMLTAQLHVLPSMSELSAHSGIALTPETLWRCVIEYEAYSGVDLPADVLLLNQSDLGEMRAYCCLLMAIQGFDDPVTVPHSTLRFTSRNLPRLNSVCGAVFRHQTLDVGHLGEMMGLSTPALYDGVL